MKYTFEVGDVVRLRSALQRITVTGIEADGQVLCVWFTEKDGSGYAGPYSSSFLRGVPYSA